MLDQLVLELAQARAEVEDQKLSVEKLERILREHPDYLDYLAAQQDLKAAKENEAACYAEVCESAVRLYDGGNKHPHPAITIKDTTVVDYDEDEFKTWAIAHNHPGLLSLNKSAAKKVATGPTAPDFVAVTVEPKATVKTDLSEYL